MALTIPLFQCLLWGTMTQIVPSRFVSPPHTVDSWRFYWHCLSIGETSKSHTLWEYDQQFWETAFTKVWLHERPLETPPSLAWPVHLLWINQHLKMGIFKPSKKCCRDRIRRVFWTQMIKLFLKYTLELKSASRFAPIALRRLLRALDFWLFTT